MAPQGNEKDKKETGEEGKREERGGEGRGGEEREEKEINREQGEVEGGGNGEEVNGTRSTLNNNKIDNLFHTVFSWQVWDANKQLDKYGLIFKLLSHGCRESKSMVSFSLLCMWTWVFFVYLSKLQYLTVSQPYQ